MAASFAISYATLLPSFPLLPSLISPPILRDSTYDLFVRRERKMEEAYKEWKEKDSWILMRWRRTETRRGWEMTLPAGEGVDEMREKRVSFPVAIHPFAILNWDQEWNRNPFPFFVYFVILTLSQPVTPGGGSGSLRRSEMRAFPGHAVSDSILGRECFLFERETELRFIEWKSDQRQGSYVINDAWQTPVNIPLSFPIQVHSPHSFSLCLHAGYWVAVCSTWSLPQKSRESIPVTEFPSTFTLTIPRLRALFCISSLRSSSRWCPGKEWKRNGCNTIWIVLYPTKDWLPNMGKRQRNRLTSLSGTKRWKCKQRK